MMKRKLINEDIPQAKRRAKHDPVKAANRLTVEEFVGRSFADVEMSHLVGDNELTIAHYDAANIPRAVLEQCFQLIETTSKADYIPSTIGWNPRHKKKEMKDRLMHYLIVQSRGCEPVVGFCSFMLTYDSTPCVPVLYIYEIHLAESLRGGGLGAKLSDICEQVAMTMGVKKVMLTCFVSNTKAQGFYTRLGFTKDPVSPENRHIRSKVMEADILILSRLVRGSTDE